jgi:hypothetical protein
MWLSPIGDETGLRRWVGPKHLETEDSHGALCGHRRVFGTVERVVVDGQGKIVKEAKVATEPELWLPCSRRLASP